MTWDAETEQDVEEALAVVRRGRCRTHTRIEDYHAWEPPPFGPIPTHLAWRDLERSALVIATSLLLVGLLAAALGSSGFTRLLWAMAGVSVIVLACATDRRLE